MRAVDTNVLVQLITRDDARQVEVAEEFVARGAWVSQVVLVETIWMLGAAYGIDHAGIARAIGMLLDHDRLTIQDSDVVTAALSTYRKRPSLGFSDCLVVEVARKAGHLPLGTFDRNLSRLEGVEKLQISRGRGPRVGHGWGHGWGQVGKMKNSRRLAQVGKMKDS
ncbi:MAG: type II toxin-antitoxin system VapC family toxin [Acidobacteria bacterium]|nr:type II toxin-antitoxin system VapC family toxin [Acidobacteriota bacterium]